LEVVAENKTKQKIIDASLIEFAKHGLAGARVDRIAEDAGVNKAMIYYHFGSKESLYMDVITDHITQSTTLLRQNISDKESIEDVLENLVETYITVFSKSPYFANILLRELPNQKSIVIERVAELIGSSEIPQILYKKISEGIVENKLRPINVKQAIVSLITMNIGFFLMAPIIKRTLNITDMDEFLAERKTAIVDLFLNGVKAQ
jgi:AcrR family transcriptional regulator